MAKRFLGNDNEGIKKTRAAGDDLQEIRVLVDNSEASVIIGKGGSNVKKIRNETGAFISILKNEHVPQVNERVTVIKGTVEANSQVMRHIAELLTEANEMGTETCTLRILIHRFLAGCIIGKGGSIIQQIKTETGAQMRVSNEPLGNSSEKTIIITGTSEVMEAGCFRIFTQISENPLKAGCQNIPYVPGYSMGHLGPHQFGMNRDGPGQYNMGREGYSESQMYGSGPMGYNSGPMLFNQKRTEKIVIPTVCAGYLIGKGGSIISDIRARSNVAQITIANPEPTTPDDRVVSITGQPHAIQKATNLIRQRIDSYKYELGGGAPGPTHVQGMGMGMGAPPAVHQMNSPGRITVQKIVIPTQCCGYIIGRGGKTIADIRAKSMVTNISLAQPEPTAPNDRVISITGTSQSIQIAISLIRDRVNNYKPNMP